MSRVVRSVRANRDLRLIVRHIALNNLSAAVHWLVSIDELFDLMAAQPYVGEAIQTRRLGRVRRISHGNYVVYFRPIRDGVHIVRVYHGARDQEKLI
jgi:toxin ParE1/3/4